MTTPDAIPIPGDRLAPIARQQSSSAKTVASIVCFFLALFTIAGIAMVAGNNSGSTTARTMEGGQTIAGVVVWFIVLGAVASHFLKAAKRSAEVARLAAGNVGHLFFLNGRQITVADLTGTNLPHLTFKLSRKRRAMLVEMPRATVVPPR